jgi:hypothetical protein
VVLRQGGDETILLRPLEAGDVLQAGGVERCDAAGSVEE